MDIQHKYFKLLVNLCIDNLWDRIIKISSDNRPSLTSGTFLFNGFFTNEINREF